MNYNPNAGMRNRKWENSQGGGRPRPNKRISDMNAMGPSAPMMGGPTFMPPTAGPGMLDPNMYGGAPAAAAAPSTGYGFNVAPSQQPQQHYQPQQQAPQNYQQPPQQQQQQQQSFGYAPSQQGGAPPPYGMPAAQAGPGGQFPQFAMLQQPIVQDMAMEYGQRLADQGRQMVENQFERWVPVAKLRYYFAVDNAYVGRKLRLLFFPYIHKDWSLKYDQEHPVQPRYDVNAPDLYLPTMGYITYVIVAGLLLGMQKRFSPEQLGIQASSAMAYSIFELVIYSIALYVMNIKTSLKTLDLLAFTGYKYVNIVACLMFSTLFYRSGYFIALAYTSFSFGFFLLRTLRTKLLQDSAPAVSSNAINYDPYSNPQELDYSGGRKRKLYFLFMVVAGQAVLAFLLSKHLYLPESEVLLSVPKAF
ncbi:protein YIF1B-A isoform X2 [Drosophila subobscura]|uniref:protein YIF1B-A isoform X2 n=1 Tax=Drosophila subobscura TaxID=7241 RepID=UPI00155A42AF|nr:protein YIF1B-A isoform X2 [Drosophila subobscura]